MNKLKTPLRYPGGKSRVSEYLVSLFPRFKEYREPFLGGGSVFMQSIQTFNGCERFWINDRFEELYSFWKGMSSDSADRIIDKIYELKNLNTEGKRTFETLCSRTSDTMEQRAADFFALNRMTFSGTTLCGGYSNEAFNKRFTDSSIERCRRLKELDWNKVSVTNEDYSVLMDTEGDDVFIFLDPPYYLGKTKSKLYGVNGELHSGFDHERFKETCDRCRHKWMITYNDCEYIRDMFSSYNITEMSFSYGMSKDKSGKEIIITNYHLTNSFHLI